MSISKKKYDAGITQVIFRTIVSDTITPVSVLMKLTDHSNSFLLESVEGGITKGPTNALIGEAGTEAVIPIEKLKQFMVEAMAPVEAAVNKLNEDFGNKYVPKLAQSNIDGAKKSSKEIGRQFQTNVG